MAIAFAPLDGVFEPSAVVQLADGRFLVVEDEKDFPFCAVTLAGGRVEAVPLPVDPAAEGARKLDDLEGLSVDSTGHVYALTSHSRDGDGDEKDSRDKLLRCRVEGERLVDVRVCRALKAALTATHPLLAAAAAVDDPKTAGGLNIEALEMAPDGRLLVGFRSPLDEGKALVAVIDNVEAVFDAGATPSISPELQRLDLGGDGLRALSYVPALAGYLAVGGPVAREQKDFRLWFWRGPGEGRPRPVTVPGLAGFAHAEGVTPAIVDGRPALLVVSDDGKRSEGRPAGYLLLDPASLLIGA
jgi:hypothetical protein